eukprot:TRINITY_DN8381_c0_g1_i2.p1 TRINITY_DN8381_c0_g1~~TRINITY_DN8381_c0_g1_i2.p1  ORF type:complete len:451 (-),score=53.42 TRINITY_DN8381_c0_g1_i2:24-1205(-)
MKLQPEMSKFAKLETLILADNKLTSLPPLIGEFPALTNLNLNRNELKGFPVEIQKLTKLKIWRCSSNFIQTFDNINVSGFKELEEIHFDNNQIDHFCPGVGGLCRLKVFNLAHNQLTELTKEIGWLGKSLRKIEVQQNKLTAVPGELTFLNRAIELNLDGNPLRSPFVQWFEESIVTLMDNLTPFCKAYAPHCTAEGDGLAHGVAGIPNQFLIISRDFEGRDRVNGGDEFVAEYSGEVDGEKILQKGIVKDLKDGKYQCFYNFKKSGKFKASITDHGMEIKGSPFDAYIEPGPAEPGRSQLDSSQLEGSTTGTPCTFSVTCRDKFGNRVSADRPPFQVNIAGPNGSSPKALIAGGAGKFDCRFTPGWSGTYAITATVNSVPLQGCPYSVNIVD